MLILMKIVIIKNDYSNNKNDYDNNKNNNNKSIYSNNTYLLVAQYLYVIRF